jgi:hypothetical protein
MKKILRAVLMVDVQQPFPWGGTSPKTGCTTFHFRPNNIAPDGCYGYAKFKKIETAVFEKIDSEYRTEELGIFQQPYITYVTIPTQRCMDLPYRGV